MPKDVPAGLNEREERKQVALQKMEKAAADFRSAADHFLRVAPSGGVLPSFASQVLADFDELYRVCDGQIHMMQTNGEPVAAFAIDDLLTWVISHKGDIEEFLDACKKLECDTINVQAEYENRVIFLRSEIYDLRLLKCEREKDIDAAVDLLSDLYTRASQIGVRDSNQKSNELDIIDEFAAWCKELIKNLFDELRTQVDEHQNREMFEGFLARTRKKLADILPLEEDTPTPDDTST